MKKWLVAFAVVCLLALPTNQVDAQEADGRVAISVVDSSQIQVIKLVDGSTIVGRVTQVRGDSVDVLTPGARIVLSRASIRTVTVRPASAMHDGEYWVANPNSSRLLFGPTAQMLKRGEGYVAAFELVFLGGAVGITDNITIGGGMLVPAPMSAYFFTPKIGFSASPNLHLAAGAMVIGTTGDTETIGVYYAATTLGQTDQSLTAGLGYGFAGNDVASKPVVMLGGEKRVSSRIAFVTENYVVPDIDPLVSLGIRFIGEKMSADLGLMRVPDGGGSELLPLVNFVVKF